MEPGLATELVVDKAKYSELPEDLQAIIRDVSQAEYDMFASDFAANDPRALDTLVNEHGVNVRQFPDEVLEAAAGAAKEVMTELRDGGDDLTKRTTESFISSLKLLRTKGETADANFIRARQKYFEM